MTPKKDSDGTIDTAESVDVRAEKAPLSGASIVVILRKENAEGMPVDYDQLHYKGFLIGKDLPVEVPDSIKEHPHFNDLSILP